METLKRPIGQEGSLIRALARRVVALSSDLIDDIVKQHVAVSALLDTISQLATGFLYRLART